MDSATMLKVATGLFGLSALGGVVLAIIRFSGVPRPPLVLAMGHGVVAAAGLTLLVYAAVMSDVPLMAQAAAVIFLVVAIVGMAMNLLFHSKGLPLPILLVIGHGAVAVLAFGLLFASL